MKLARQLARLTLACAAIAAVWLPHFSHFAIDRTDIGGESIRQLRDQPSDSVLAEIAAMTQGVGHDGLQGDVVTRANRVLAGYLDMPTLLAVPYRLQGHPQDYQYGPPTFQLFMAGLGAEDWLLSAYTLTADLRFMAVALERVLAFAAHERRQLQDVGFLWNDHAVAARMGVLIKLWRHLRQAKDVDEGVRREVLSLALRSARLLAERDHFTVRTNHGVVQNLALLQAAAAFPMLAEAPQWRRTAIERLESQLGFYVSDEGMVLEHSAAYHQLGVDLLARIVRLVALNEMVPPAFLADAARRTRAVLEKLVRPDGSLPLLGNTTGGPKVLVPFVPDDGSQPVSYRAPSGVAGPASVLMPLSGYAMWWLGEHAGLPSQTLVTWANHVGHGHKHADEGALMFWSGGVDWITSTGYWPYGALHMDEAYSWPGSNAPHASGEAAGADREAELLSYSIGSQVAFVEVDRTVAGGGRLRRQVLQLGANELLVLDFAEGITAGTEVIWTVDRRLSLASLAGPSSFLSSAAPDGRRMAVVLAGHPVATTTLRRGSTSPFAGWTVEDFRPVPAHAIHVRQAPGGAANATYFKVTNPGETGVPRLVLRAGSAAERWTTEIIMSNGLKIEVSRDGLAITLGMSNQEMSVAGPTMIALQSVPPIDAQRHALRQAYLDAVATYPQWRNLGLYRERVSWALVGLAITLELTGWLAVRVARGRFDRARRACHWASVLMWILLPLWLVNFYLQA